MPARALSVSVQTSERKIAVGLALQEGRAGKEHAVAMGCSARDTRNFFTMSASLAKSGINLHRAGAEHHVAAIAPDLVHVGRHDALHGHAGGMTGVSARVHSGEAPRPRKADAQPVTHGAHLIEVLVDLVPGVMDIGKRRAGEFKLAAGFERDGRQALGVGQRDEVLALIYAGGQRAPTARAAEAEMERSPK